MATNDKKKDGKKEESGILDDILITILEQKSRL
jgi:hypothetical protein